MKNSEISYRQTTKTESNEQLLLLRIAFLDVGQADTIVITCPDTHEAIVVDCVDADAVLDYLEAEHITYLRGVIILIYMPIIIVESLHSSAIIIMCRAYKSAR